jgi:hypothetical protein
MKNAVPRCSENGNETANETEAIVIIFVYTTIIAWKRCKLSFLVALWRAVKAF